MRWCSLVGLVVLVLSSCAEAGEGPADGLAFRYEPTIVRVAGSGTASPVVELLAVRFSETHPEVRFEFGSGTNSGGGVRGVAEGTLDLGVANRPLKPEEEAMGVGYHPFARDAMVFAVNQPNPLTGLSTDEVRSLFGGEITDWSAFGGSPSAVILLGRDPDESATKLFFDPIMDGTEVAPSLAVLAKSAEMVDSLRSTPGAIGFTTLGSLVLAEADNVEALALDGISPSSSSVADGTYEWVMTFAVVTGPGEPSPVIADFVDFIGSPEAAELLGEYGYAPAG